jgi:large subunit ribosomal protein L22
VSKVVRSAAANAEANLLMDQEDLRIVEVFADGGPSLKRFRPEARGRAGRITKRTSHITVVVDEEVPSGA